MAPLEVKVPASTREVHVVARIIWFYPSAWGPPRRGADVRTEGLIASALANGYEVALVSPCPESTVEPPAGMHHLHLPGYRPGPLWALRKVASRHPLVSPRVRLSGRRALRQGIQDWAPDLAVVSGVMAWALAEPLTLPGLPVVYDAHNVEHVLHAQLAARERSVNGRATMTVDARRVLHDESDLARRSTAILAVSDADAEAFRGAFPYVPVHVVPSTVRTPQDPARPREAGHTVLFVGALDYAPNVLAVEELIVEVLPRVRERVPNAELTIVGRGAAAALAGMLQRASGVSLHDNVDDLEPFYRRARCVAVPIRSGGGTKLKAIEAMAFGVPMVCTQDTVRGIDVRPDEVVIAGTVPEMVDGVVGLLVDPEMAGRLGGLARQAFLTRLSREACVDGPLGHALTDVLAR